MGTRAIPIPGDDVIITVPADMQAGVWANWGAISESEQSLTGAESISP